MGTRASTRGAVALGAAAAWELSRRVDRHRIARDPEHRLLSAPPAGRPRTVASHDGTRLHVEEFGPEDGPPLVLVHGWTCALRFWAYQLAALSPSHRVVAFDLRGHGRSAPAHAGDYSMEAFAGDLDAVLHATAGDDPAVVAGHSLGAMTLVAWAGIRPEEVDRRLAAAALLNTGVGDLLTESLVLRTPRRLSAVQRLGGRALLAAPAPLPSSPTPVSHRVVRYVALSPDASPAQVAFCEEMVLSCRRRVRAGAGATLSRLDLREGVASLTVPTLVLAGERDRLTPPVHARQLAEALPDVVELVEVPGAGHMTPVEQPGEVSRRLAALLARAEHGAAVAAGGAGG